MSYTYGQFGAGFGLSQPSREAQQFRDLVKTRGEGVTIIALTEAGEDDYGNPVYNESSYTEKAFVERESRERVMMPGTAKKGYLRLFVVQWAAVREDGCEVDVDGFRYHVTGVDKTAVCLEVEAERKVE